MDLGVVDVVVVVGAGFAAGAVNTVVGSGSLITFPVLIALGLDPVVANVSNTVGLVPASVSGAVGYRRELRGQGRRIAMLAPAAALGGLAGALLLVGLPGSAFERVVPALLLLACGLVLMQPRISRALATRTANRRAHVVALWLAVLAVSVYGGYFGAAQSVLLIAFLGMFLPDDLQRLNATKNVLSAVVNAVAAALFVVLAHVDWTAAAAIAAGGIVGGQVGATVGRRLPQPLLRAVIVVVGGVVAVRMMV